MRADAYEQREVYGFNCEVRAVEEAGYAFVQPGGSCNVKSTSGDETYSVRFVGLVSGGIHFVCTCKSGQNRGHLPVPCKHAARVGRRLVREGIAVWENGLFNIAPKLQAEAEARAEAKVPEDVFEGLPQ